MSTEQNMPVSQAFLEDVVTIGNLAAVDELCEGGKQEALARTIFQLAFALASEPSKLGQLNQMLMNLQEQRVISECFSAWAIGQINERIRSMALEYAHDAEIMIQILSFKGGTFASLVQDIEDIYQHEQITLRVYVKAKLLLHWAQTEMPASGELL